jgi:hypothetical protein
MTRTNRRLLGTVPLLLALAGTASVAAATDLAWPDNEGIAPSDCNADLPAVSDPHELMSTLRERGLATDGQVVRLGAQRNATVTLTPTGAAWRCDGSPTSAAFRMSTADRASPRADTRPAIATSQTAGTLPAAPIASNR